MQSSQSLPSSKTKLGRKSCLTQQSWGLGWPRTLTGAAQDFRVEMLGRWPGRLALPWLSVNEMTIKDHLFVFSSLMRTEQHNRCGDAHRRISHVLADTDSTAFLNSECQLYRLGEPVGCIHS